MKRIYHLYRRSLTTMPNPNHFLHTSGETDPVWIHALPYKSHPTFPSLTHDLETDVCIIGSGITGIQTAYELISRGKRVTMLEARDILSGESGRTSGHLSNALDDGYAEIKKKHGGNGAKLAAESHSWAITRVSEIVSRHHIDCEFRFLTAYEISQFERLDPRHAEEVKGLKAEVEVVNGLRGGLEVEFCDGATVPGWKGKDQRDAAVFRHQATFHPTKYLIGVLGWLTSQPGFRCFTHSRMVDVEEGRGGTRVRTADGHTVTARDVVEATCVPLQKLSIISEMEYMRTYCIAVRVPRGSVADCLVYDEAEAYKYVRLTGCDAVDDYMVVGGCDHKVGQETAEGRFAELETWVRERFPQARTVDYRWSGQIYEPVDYMAFIGKNQGKAHTYVSTGDSGNGLTHGVLAGRLIADEIEGTQNPWARLYSPKRLASVAKALPSMLEHDVQINTQYKRWLQSDIKDIEDLAVGTGGVLHKTMGQPVAVYKDEAGVPHKFSAVCPHMKGILTWNNVEKSWDCPVHGSRFSCDGICIGGPAKTNLTPIKG